MLFRSDDLEEPLDEEQEEMSGEDAAVDPRWEALKGLLENDNN